MDTQNGQVPPLRELLGEEPVNNWGRWGEDDELGSVNYLGRSEALAGVAEVRSGESFTLQVQMGRQGGNGDPVWPGRFSIRRRNVRDAQKWADGQTGLDPYPGGLQDADDVAEIALQGSTQYDALGHTWYDGKIWNGYDASTTAGELEKASILPIAEHGIVGRGVLLDMARHRGKRFLDKGETFTHEDLQAAAEQQGTEIRPRDVLVVRTGFIGSYYSRDAGEFYEDFVEPGLTYSRELAEWFQAMEIPNLVTDTIANEVTYDPRTGVLLPLHAVFLRNLGITMTEIAQLDELADACAAEGRWSFLYTAAPLKVVGGTGAPVNPIVVR
jgi:kynurenine formamidase